MAASDADSDMEHAVVLVSVQFVVTHTCLLTEVVLLLLRLWLMCADSSSELSDSDASDSGADTDSDSDASSDAEVGSSMGPSDADSDMEDATSYKVSGKASRTSDKASVRRSSKGITDTATKVAAPARPQLPSLSGEQLR